MPKKNDLFVDTSGWAYYLDRQDPLYPKVVALVQSAVMQRRRLVTTNFIITELVALLSSRFHLPHSGWVYKATILTGTTRYAM